MNGSFPSFDWSRRVTSHHNYMNINSVIQISLQRRAWAGGSGSPFTQELEGSTPIRRHMSEWFFRSSRPGYLHSVCSELEKVVSEWRSVAAVLLFVGGAVRLTKPAKLPMCSQKHTTRLGCVWYGFISSDGGLVKQAQLEQTTKKNSLLLGSERVTSSRCL